MPDDIFEICAGKFNAQSYSFAYSSTRRRVLSRVPYLARASILTTVFALQYQACAAFLLQVRFQAYQSKAQNRPMIPTLEVLHEICSLSSGAFYVTIAAIAQEHPALSAAAKFRYTWAPTENSNRLPTRRSFNSTSSAQEKRRRPLTARVKRMPRQVREVLRANGIEPKSATVGFFSVQPMV